MTYKIITFGCRLNQAESDKISADLVMAGLNSVKKNQPPYLIILNVCAVTHKAVREARQKVAQLKRNFPQSKIAVTGCIDENNWPGVDAWIPNSQKNKIISIIQKKLCLPDNIKTLKQKNIKTKTSSRTRAFIKIQEGCNNFCAYCIVPLVRGKPKSRGVEEIIKDVQDQENQGYKEIVLTGVNIGLYNTRYPIPDTKKISNPPANRLEPRGGWRAGIQYSIFKSVHKNEFIDLKLTELLCIILENTNIPRIRLSSLWPTHLSSKLINLIAKEPRICSHLHLSIQSGSNQILKSMGRSYTVKDILKIITQAKKKIPRINFTCDLIVGFPGETDQDFQDSCQLVEKVGFSKVHIFKYSKRPKTKATRMVDQVAEKIKQARSQDLTQLAEKKSRQFKQNFIGQEFNILWERKKDGYWYGFTENYIRVKKKVGQKKLDNLVEYIKLKKAHCSFDSK